MFVERLRYNLLSVIFLSFEVIFNFSAISARLPRLFKILTIIIFDYPGSPNLHFTTS